MSHLLRCDAASGVYAAALLTPDTQAYFQRGRIAMTVDAGLADSGDYSLTSDADISLASASAYPIKDIWVTAEDVRKTPSIFP